MSLGLILYLLLTQPVYNRGQLGLVIVRKEVGPREGSSRKTFKVWTQ
jgi:hypothetical protein